MAVDRPNQAVKVAGNFLTQIKTDLQDENRQLCELLRHSGVVLGLAEDGRLVVAIDHLNHHQRLVLPLAVGGDQPELVALLHLVVQRLSHEDGAHLGLHVERAHGVPRGDLVAQLGVGACREEVEIR